MQTASLVIVLDQEKIKNKVNLDIKEVIRKYNGLEGTEYFNFYDIKNKFRIKRIKDFKNNNDVIPTLTDHALVRELHVYGVMTPHNSDNKEIFLLFYYGFGKRMLKILNKLHISME